MPEELNAAFKFEGFRIPSFSYKEGQTELLINFNPSGKFFQGKGIFELYLEFEGNEKANPDNTVIRVNSIGTFKFKEETIAFEAIPPYFYQSCIAILFPYLRAFVSTMTLQANTGLLLLAVKNLIPLEKTLREKTSVVVKS